MLSTVRFDAIQLHLMHAIRRPRDLEGFRLGPLVVWAVDGPLHHRCYDRRIGIIRSSNCLYSIVNSQKTQKVISQHGHAPLLNKSNWKFCLDIHRALLIARERNGIWLSLTPTPILPVATTTTHITASTSIQSKQFDATNLLGECLVKISSFKTFFWYYTI